MEFGISCSKIDETGLATHAENLGYDFCWVTDSPMLRSNPWAVMALVAQQTRKMRIGTGVAVPGLRLAPVAANGIATIARLAPGRVFMGIGTGNTAMRTLGHRPARVAEFREYIRVVRGLLRGEEVDYTLDGVTHPIRFQNPDLGYLSLADEIPIHVGGFGPQAQALAGEVGDGLITGIPRGVARSPRPWRTSSGVSSGATATSTTFASPPSSTCCCWSQAKRSNPNVSSPSAVPPSWPMCTSWWTWHGRRGATRPTM